MPARLQQHGGFAHARSLNRRGNACRRRAINANISLKSLDSRTGDGRSGQVAEEARKRLRGPEILNAAKDACCLASAASTFGSFRLWSDRSALIMFSRPAKRAPPASARNSLQRENHITTSMPKIDRIIWNTMTNKY